MKFIAAGYKELTKDNIFSEITQYDIFSYYIPDFDAINKSFCSPLRNNIKQSCRVQSFDDVLIYKDFGTGESFDAIGFVKSKFGCTYKEVLSIISADFNLGLHSKTIEKQSMGFIGERRVKQESVPEVSVLKIKRRDFNNTIDKDYWTKAGWDKKILKHFKVVALSHLWVNDMCFTMKNDNPSYAYILDPGIYKILSPYSEYKWISNCSSEHVQGWEQLPPTGDLVIITSSLKDCGTLYRYGYSAIAPTSETTGVSIDTITELQSRFKRVVVFYDNDGEFNPPPKVNGKGKQAAKKLVDQYQLEMVFIPDGDPKDISDYYHKWGDKPTKQLLELLL